MKTWFNIQAKKQGDDEIVDISIFDEIGYWGVTAKSFIDELNAKKGSAKKGKLSINSPGGSVFDGFAIFNALKASGIEWEVQVMGIAASMGSVIAMVGKTRKMPANTMMMVHNAISGVYGDAEDLKAVVDVLEKIDNSIVATYVATTGKSEKEVRDLMAADTFMTAAQALELGFATEVTDEVKATACFALDNLPENVRAMFKASATKPGNEVDKPFAEQVEALAKEAGLEEFAANLALNHTTLDGVKAAITAAREVKALCVLAKQPEAAAGFINANKPIADVRKALIDKMAEQDEATHTSSLKPANKGEVEKKDGFAAVDTRAIYDKRNKRQGAASR